jgi:hypothetical protein
VQPRHLGLGDFTPELVPASDTQLYLRNRALPAPTPLQPSPLAEAIYDARERTLLLTFTPGTPQLTVVYPRLDSELELIVGKPNLRELLADFPLDPHRAEVRVDVGEESWLVPISFRHLPELLCEEPDGDLSFWEFVDLLSGRHAPKQETTNDANQLPQERVAPQRVFRAIRALVEEIGGLGSALGAFRVALDGPTGLKRFIARLPIRGEGDEALDRHEAWLYGQELARALRTIRFAKDAAGRYKAQAIAEFVAEVEAKLKKIEPKGAQARALVRFYGETR